MLNATTTQCELVRILESNACVNTTTLPTRIQNDSATLLDVFITNIDTQKLVSGVIGVNVSDNLPIFLMTNQNAIVKSFKDIHILLHFKTLIH